MPTEHMLSPGKDVTTTLSRTTCRVKRFLGDGTQGEVYEVDLAGQSVALKWYYPHMATAQQRSDLEALIQKGSPSVGFLWPMEIAEADGIAGFGYFMPLRHPEHRKIVELMKRRVKPTFRSLATAGMNLADRFLMLHSKGWCYRDINFGNAFINFDTGGVLICDNDNVVVNGASIGGVAGTPRFMAPEIVCGSGLPDTQTDLFSLSVLLFYILMLHHPLEGRRELTIKCFDLPAMTKLYGTDPLFIFDPCDRSNEPVPGYHDNAIAFWPIYPEFLRALFTRAFTDGIRDPQNGRVRESEWRAALSRLRDSILYCQRCGSENFYDSDALQASNGKPPVCWSCRGEIQLPPRIRIGRSVVMLNHDSVLYPHHIDPDRMYDFSCVVGAVTQHPTNKNIWGLKNLSDDKWVATLPDGTVRDVANGQSVPLVIGTHVLFGKSEGEMRA